MNNPSTFNLPISISYPFVLRWRSNLKAFWIFSVVLIILLLTFYVFQINSLIQNTYVIQGYEEKVKDLTEGNKKLEINLAELNSLQNLEHLVKSLNYTEAGKIKYIQVLGGQVVTK